MKKWAYIFFAVIAMSLIYNIPVCGNPYFDKLDPVDDQYVLVPGYLALEVGGLPLPPDLFITGACSYNFNNNIGIKAGGVLEFDQGLSFGASMYGKKGPLYGELGVDFRLSFSIHTGFDGFFPLYGQSGPGFETDLNIDKDGSVGQLKGGWIWLYGKHSRLLVGGRYNYRPYIDSSDKVIGYVESVLDERAGPWLFEGKAEFGVLHDCIALGAHFSTAYLFANLIGIGIDLNGEYYSYDGLTNNVWGIMPTINLSVRH